MKVVVYARRSTAKATQQDTIDNQIKICTRRAKELGLEVVDEFTDTGSGRDDDAREDIKKMIELSSQGIFQGVIMKGISRFYRNVEEGLRLIKRLDRSGIRVITVEENFDSSLDRTSTGQLDTSMITLHLLFAERESQKTSERIKYTQIEKAHAGEWNQPGSVPYGYSYNSDTKKLEVDYTNSETIKTIFNLYLDGLGMKAIAQYLNGDNKDGISHPSPKGARWSQYTVGFMLKNKVYIGYVVYNKRSRIERPYKNPEALGKSDEDIYTGNDYNEKKDWIITPDAHEAIISKEIFDRVQSLIESKGIRKGIRNNTSLMASLAKCGKCGKGMTFKRGNKDKEGNIRTRSNYYCSNYIKYGKRYCTSHHVRASEFEDLIISQLQSKIDERIDERKVKSNLKKSGDSSLVKERNLRRMERDIEHVMKKMEVLLEKNIEGSVNDIQFSTMNKKNTEELEYLTLQTDKIKKELMESNKEGSEEDFLKRHYESVKNIRNYPKEKQRQILLDLINKIVVDDGKIEIEYMF